MSEYQVAHACASCARQSDLPITCRRCRKRFRAHLLELPSLLVYVHMSLVPDRGASSGRAPSRTHAPLPVRTDMLSLLGPAGNPSSTQDQEGPAPVLAILQGWADLVAEGTCHTPVRRHVNDLTGFLLHHLAWACRQPYAGDLMNEVADLVRTLRGITRAEPRWVTLSAACPRCELLALVREDHSGWTAECLGCGKLMTEEEYARVVQAAVEAAQDKDTDTVSTAS